MKNLFILLLVVSSSSFSQETLLLSSPSVSINQIAFAYGGNIWVADKDGLHPQQLTVKQSVESSPMLSPDGKWVAFTGNYDGNEDVYIISSGGGMPKRLTFHPAGEVVRSWTGNDKIVFSSVRQSWHPFIQKLFTVDINSGEEETLLMPEASQGSISPDGKFTAYVRTLNVNEWAAFRLYRGGDMARIWLFNNQTHDVEEIPPAHSNNLNPVWVNNEFIYFLSDRDNHYENIYKYNIQTREITPVTTYKDFDVRNLYSNGKQLAYEQAGKIFLLDPANDQSKHIPVYIKEDMVSGRPYYGESKGMIRNMNISPTGLRAVFEVRGEIVTIPADKGDTRNITQTPGINERDPAWSGDGKYVAYFSDEGGEYKLKLIDQKGQKKPVSITLDSAGFYYHPVWSPDSKKIAYTDKQKKLYVIDINEKKPVEIDQDKYSIGQPQINYSWSVDSKWIAYNTRVDNHFGAIFLFDVVHKIKHQVTDARSEASYPVFSKNGKYLFFTASTNYGPAQSWLDLSSYNYYVISNIYAIVLSKKTPSLLEPKSDEEIVQVAKNESSEKARIKKTKKR